MQLLQLFIEHITNEKKYSPHTILAYQKDLEQFAEFLKETFAEEHLAEVTYTMIRSWIIHLKSNGIQNKSINRKISTLQLFYKHLIRLEKIDSSPLAKHRSLKVGKKEEIPFSQTEVEQVLNAFAKDDFISLRNHLIIAMLYATGMRRAELVGLQEKDIDYANEQLKVLGKRNKERIIPLLPSVVEQVKYYVEQKKEITDNTALFVDKAGFSIKPHTVYKAVRDAFEIASTKLKKSPHILRHSFATHLLNNGANLMDVKSLLGHASLASTQVYTHNSIAKLKLAHKTAHPRSKK